MKKLVAAWLLACFGTMLPMAAGPLRFCLIEQCLLVAAEDSDCCPDCDRETDAKDPCCVDLDALPDAPVPQPSLELPPVIASDLPAGSIATPVASEAGRKLVSESTPIRGPAPPAAYRAVLGIWRL